MDDWNFNNIRLLIGEPTDEVRRGLRSALSLAGFDNIEDTGQVSVIRQAVQGNNVDLLVCDTEVADGELGALIQQIRHREIGDNPFIAIITLIPVADERRIKAVMGSGTDDILVLPVSPKQLVERIQHLIQERKPFVVTSDYIGPDRRTGHRPGTQRIPRIPVPNPLRAKTAKAPDEQGLRAEIEKTAKLLDDQKVERQGFQIVFLVDRIMKAYPAQPSDEDVRADLGRLARVADDIGRRLDGGAFAHWRERCERLAGVMADLAAADMAAADTEMFELRKLAEEFRADVAGPAPAAKAG